MQHYPVFLSMHARRVAVCGGGETALAKLRLLLKTPAQITVYAAMPNQEITALAAAGKITLIRRALAAQDPAASLLFAAHNAPRADKAAAAIGAATGALVNIVDNLEASDFITPAIVDRAPVTVAICTEGTAPMLARKIKSDLEASLPTELGLKARAGRAFRRAAEALPEGYKRRAFWQDFYSDSPNGENHLARLQHLMARHIGKAPSAVGHVTLMQTPTDAPDLLSLRARRKLEAADCVIYAVSTSAAVLELARREAMMICGAGDKARNIAAQLAAQGKVVVWIAPASAQLGVLAAQLQSRGVPHDLLPYATPATAHNPRQLPANLAVSPTTREASQ